MHKIAVIYFSGTGNTRFISELIRDNFSKHETDLFPVEDILNNVIAIDINNYDIIGIGCPSIAFNPPGIIVDFCRILDEVNYKRAFLFLTCAGPCYLNNVAFFGIKKILRRKGYHVIYEKVICMPANILLKYDNEIVKRIYDSAIKKVQIMTSDILNNKIRIRKDRLLPYLFRWFLIFIAKIALITVPLDFMVNKECNKCMTCIRNCPRKNITYKKRIKFGLKCEACYRCVYSCPQKAIKGRLYNIAIIKEGYNIQEIFERTKDIKIKNKLKGIWKTMNSYFNSRD